MKVSSINKNYSAQNFKGIEQALVSASKLSSCSQRLALGAAAVTIQPVIDLHNKDVDEKTRKISANRSIAKGIVGTTTGIIIRGGCMKAVEKLLQNNKVANCLAKATKETLETIQTPSVTKKYSQVIGTFVALGVMLYTNFAIDAPLTNYFSNKLNKKYEEAPKKEGGIQ